MQGRKQAWHKVKPVTGAGGKPRSRTASSSAAKSRGAKSKGVTRTPAQPEIPNNPPSDAKLWEHHEILSAFMDSATDAFTIWDSQLNLIELNQAAMRYLPAGTAKKDVIGKNILKFEPDLKGTGRLDRYLKVMETGQPFFTEAGGLHLQIARIAENTTLNLKVFKVSNGLGMITTDITERKWADDRETRRQARLEKVLVLAANISQVTDLQACLLTINESVRHGLEFDRVGVVSL